MNRISGWEGWAKKETKHQQKKLEWRQIWSDKLQTPMTIENATFSNEMAGLKYIALGVNLLCKFGIY